MVESNTKPVLPKFVRLTIYAYLNTRELLTLACVLNRAEREMIPLSAIVCTNRQIELWRLDITKMAYLLTMVTELSLCFCPKQEYSDTKEFYQYIKIFAINIGMLPERFMHLKLSLT